MNVRYSDFFMVEQVGGAVIVRFEVSTMLDAASIRDVAGDLYALVDQHAMSDLVLDLAGVRFLSSQALGMLVNLQRKIRAAGGHLVLTGANENIARMFRITRLDCLFTFYEQPQQALQALGGPGCCQMAGMPQPPGPLNRSSPARS